MAYYMEAWQPEAEAIRLASQITMILERDTSRVSPGQWALVEKYMNTVVRPDFGTGKSFAVADYVGSK